MEIIEWLSFYAEKDEFDYGLKDGEKSQIWVTKCRGDYITHVGMEDKLDYLKDLIYVSSIWEPGKPVNIGFNETEQKWYGWSHRAKYGFGVGSECKKGHVHYMPVDEDDFLEDMIRFWSEDEHLNVIGEHATKNGEDGVYIEWEISQSVPNEAARGEITGNFHSYPKKYGKGGWVAKSMLDARQMAIDFASNIA